jgi:hypothetical protein
MGSGSSPLSCVVFLLPPLSEAFPLLVAGCMPLLPPEPLRPTLLFYLQFWVRIIFPQSLALRAPHPLSHVSLFLLLITQFLFFSPGGGQSVQGAMLLWPRVVCGSTAVPLSSPCLHLPKLSGCGRVAAWWPSWFLCLTWSGDALSWLEVWRGQSFASSWWFCLQGVSPASLQDFTIGGTLYASSL